MKLTHVSKIICHWQPNFQFLLDTGVLRNFQQTSGNGSCCISSYTCICKATIFCPLDKVFIVLWSKLCSCQCYRFHLLQTTEKSTLILNLTLMICGKCGHGMKRWVAWVKLSLISSVWRGQQLLVSSKDIITKVTYQLCYYHMKEPS